MTEKQAQKIIDQLGTISFVLYVIAGVIIGISLK